MIYIESIKELKHQCDLFLSNINTSFIVETVLDSCEYKDKNNWEVSFHIAIKKDKYIDDRYGDTRPNTSSEYKRDIETYLQKYFGYKPSFNNDSTSFWIIKSTLN